MSRVRAATVVLIVLAAVAIGALTLSPFGQATDRPIDPVEAVVLQPLDVDDVEITADCDAREAELVRREELDLIDWDALEDERIDPDLVDEQAIELVLPAFDGAVAADGERVEVQRFGDSFDVEAATDRELLEAVIFCEEIGYYDEE